MIDDLICDVGELVTKKGIVTALIVKLDAARASLVKDNEKPSIKQLNAFIKFVSSMAGSEFDFEASVVLIQDAEAIICVIDPTQQNC